MLVREAPLRKFLPTLERYEPVSLDHSATKAYKECPRKYFYRYVLGRTPRTEKNNLVFGLGNAVHKFFEVLYQTGDFTQATLEGMQLHRNPAPDDSKKDQTIYNRLRLLKIFKECFEFYAREQKMGNITVLAIEQPFSIQLPDGTITGGRADQIISQNGGTWVRDWKTTSKQIQFFATGFDPNDQATRYIYAACRLKGWTSDDPDPTKMAKGLFFTVIQNMESESSIRIETVPVTKNIHQLIEWEKDQIFWYAQMERSRLYDQWPMSENGCGWCDYRPVCRIAADSSREYALKSNYDLKPWVHENVLQEKI